jgi:ureidoacrylate peracid hydrolase
MEFPQWIVDRVVARQGRLHTYDHIDAQRTAFVVVDLQNYFMMPGYLGECAASRATIPAVNRLASSLRQAGGTVVWIQTASDGAEKFWSHHHTDMLTLERSKRRLDELQSNTPGYALHSDLDVRPNDLRVVKRCYSALVPGSSNLADVLQSRGIETVLIGGTVTNACCESTARDAMMMNFKTIMVEDALSALSEFEHVNALCNWKLMFGDVLSADEVIARLETTATDAAA